MGIEIRPCEYGVARSFVEIHHRHNKPPVGHKFSIACYDGDRLCGVAMVGCPVGRYFDDGMTLEVNRCCTDGTWAGMIHDGFWECMRVLKPYGTLIFKWSEVQIPTRKVIDAIGVEPLFGNRSGKAANTHWMVFMKFQEEDANGD